MGGSSGIWNGNNIGSHLFFKVSISCLQRLYHKSDQPDQLTGNILFTVIC